MRNFEKKLEDASNEELRLWINELDFRVVPLASDELTRRSLFKLQQSIRENTEEVAKFKESTKKFNVKTGDQTTRLICLTNWIVVLTVAMLIGLSVQIYYARKQTIPLDVDQVRYERDALGFCSGGNNDQLSWKDKSGKMIPCPEIVKMYSGKF